MVDRLCTSLAGLSLSAIRRYTALAAEREDCITLTIGEPDLPTPAPICEAAVRALAGGSTHYTANQGSASLRAKLAAYEAKTRQLDYGPDEIIVTAGATEAIYCALTGVLRPRRRGRDPDARLRALRDRDTARRRCSRVSGHRPDGLSADI